VFATRIPVFATPDHPTYRLLGWQETDYKRRQLGTQEEDEALINGIKWNGYGNWGVILKKEKRLLGSKDEKKLGDRANQLLAH